MSEDNEFNDEDLFDFGLKTDEILNTRKMSEQNNLSALSKQLKNINLSISNIDESLIDIIWNLDNIIEDIENGGQMFQQDSEEATSRILELIDVTHEMIGAFDKMKQIKDSLNPKRK